MRSLTKWLDRLSKVRLLVVGDLVADHYVFGQTERVSREAPVLIVRHEREEVRLGGGANAAANARALGGKVRALGVLGDDPMGRALKKQLGAAGIEVLAAGGHGIFTETKMRVLAGGQSTTRQQMLRVDRGATGPLPQPVRRALAKKLQAALKGTDVVAVSDYGGGVVCDETREVLVEWSKEGGVVCADSRFGLAALGGVAVCKPNEPELAALTGLPVQTDDELALAAERARQLLRCETLLVTRGRNGMALFTSKKPQWLAVHGVEEAVDVTGAGDTVHATFALALGAGAPALEAAHLANVAGALVVMKPGTATVTRDELKAELSK